MPSLFASEKPLILLVHQANGLATATNGPDGVGLTHCVRELLYLCGIFEHFLTSVRFCSICLILFVHKTEAISTTNGMNVVSNIRRT